jgi:hypothetical protein
VAHTGIGSSTVWGPWVATVVPVPERGLAMPSRTLSSSRIRVAVQIVAVGVLLSVFAYPASAASPPAMVADIRSAGSSGPTELTAVGSKLFFSADDGTTGRELWKSN